MLASFRPGLLICAALTATYMVPAQAGPSGEPLLPVATASLPKVAVPELLDPQGEPTLSQPQAEDTQSQADDETAPAVTPGEDLATMVAELRSPDAGSRE